MHATAVTFDYGQTLCELDTAMLSRRLAERGLHVSEERLAAAELGAWRAYDRAILEGHGGHPWKVFMSRLLELAGVPAEPARPVVDWLWTEQPAKNLWRRPIPDMLELVRELHRAGVPLGIVSNSEGRLAELVDETPYAGLFAVVADSGKLGFEKPDARIFRWAATMLGVPIEEIAQVGDSYPADVLGAIDAGMLAVWFQPRLDEPVPERARAAEDAAGVRRALAEWGIAPAR